MATLLDVNGKEEMTIGSVSYSLLTPFQLFDDDELIDAWPKALKAQLKRESGGFRQFEFGRNLSLEIIQCVLSGREQMRSPTNLLYDRIDVREGEGGMDESSGES